MSYALHRMFLWTSALLLVEAVLLGVAIVLYFYDIPTGFRTLVQPTYWIIATVAIFVLNFLILWVTEIKLSRIRSRNDLGAANIIGSDVQEAYNFGQIGLVITDENDMVLWTNNLFRERKIDLLDCNILEWKDKLAVLKNAPFDHSEKIEVNDRFYAVKYLSDARLYIFKDITDYEQVSQFNHQQATCIGIIMIDNYSDVAGKTEDDNNDLISKVRNVIFEYGKKMGVTLRRFRSDSYFAVCNYASLAKMEEDGFSLLAESRALGRGLQIVPTLSIGFAHNNDDVTKLSEMASNAIDIANSRGGDQAVVSHYGQDLRYYGGKTAAVENTGRVQFRSVADSLMTMISGSSDVIVSGHKDADMDAIGACLGILAFADYCKKPCHIVYDPRSVERRARAAFQTSFEKAAFERITLTPKEAEDRISPSTLFVVVDTSVPSLVLGKAALDKSSKTVVIDHHRRGGDFIDRPVLNYIDPSAGSTCEILSELIKYATANPRVEITPACATLMLSGIFLDTYFFKSKATGIRSFEAAEILKVFGADNVKATDFLKDEIEEFNLINKVASTMKSPHTGVMYCVCADDDIVEKSFLAKVANNLREQIRGVSACFVIGRTGEDTVSISARSDGTINVGLLTDKLGGGGQYDRAGAAFANVKVGLVESKLLDCLDTYLEEARSDLGGERI